MDLGMDIGTSRVVIASDEKGVLLDEAATIAVSRDTGRLVACGDEAEEMWGREPSTILVSHPMKNGVIAEYDLAEQMIRTFLSRVISNRITKPGVALNTPRELTQVEQSSLTEAVISAGARRAVLVPGTVAAGLGAGLDFSGPNGTMVVNVGGGIVNAAILTMQREAVSAYTHVAGIAADEAIIRYMRDKFGMAISDREAERAKKAIGCVSPEDNTGVFEIRGRNLLTGLPDKFPVSGDKMAQALSEFTEETVNTIQRVLESTPPELAGDMIENGIVLTGGQARLVGLTGYLQKVTGIECRVAEDPTWCVAKGLASVFHHTGDYSTVYTLGNSSYRLSDSVTN